MNLADFSQWLKSALPTTAVALAAAWALFEWFGKKWIEDRFNRKLEAYKGEQQKELERLRHLLNSRISKIHEKEFEVLPQAWLMLNDLRGAVHRALDLTMKPYPDFRNFSQSQLEEFLKSEAVKWLSDYQRDKLRNASGPDRQEDYYMEALQAHNMDEANDKHRLFLNYLIEHQIFMTDELREKLFCAQKSLFSALTSYEIGRGADHELARSGQEEMIKNMQTRIDEVDKAVQKRLHYEEA